MPPLATKDVDTDGVTVVSDWITALGMAGGNVVTLARDRN